MASSNEFKNYIMEQLSILGDKLDCKQMMGEFLLYYNDVLFGGIYDNRLLLKKTQSNEIYHLFDAIPYPDAKPMYLVENTDDADYLKNIVMLTVADLEKNK